LGAIKPQEQKTRHESKAYKETRTQQESEKVVMTNDKTGKIIKPKVDSNFNDEQKILFKQLLKLNTNYSLPDSNSLNRLTMAMYELNKNSELIADLSPLDAEYQILKKNIRDFDAMANYHESALGITLKDRYKAAADATKIIIEQKKLEAMQGPQVIVQDPRKTAVMNILGGKTNEQSL